MTFPLDVIEGRQNDDNDANAHLSHQRQNKSETNTGSDSQELESTDFSVGLLPRTYNITAQVGSSHLYRVISAHFHKICKLVPSRAQTSYNSWDFASFHLLWQESAQKRLLGALNNDYMALKAVFPTHGAKVCPLVAGLVKLKWDVQMSFEKYRAWEKRERERLGVVDSIDKVAGRMMPEEVAFMENKDGPHDEIPFLKELIEGKVVW